MQRCPSTIPRLPRLLYMWSRSRTNKAAFPIFLRPFSRDSSRRSTPIFPHEASRRTRSYSTTSPYLEESESSLPEIDEQERLKNLGSMIDSLRTYVPLILQESLPKPLLSPQVLLRICPSHFESINSYLPNIKGHVSYYAACKTAQILLTSLVLNPRAQFHIESIRTSKFTDPSCYYTNSTKVFIRWSTCPEGCDHLVDTSSDCNTESPSDSTLKAEGFSTASASLGSHKWSEIDAVEFLNHHRKSWSISSSIADLGKGMIGLRKEDSKLERIISGLFIFELNERNDRILVHTIENLNSIERKAKQTLENKLRMC